MLAALVSLAGVMPERKAMCRLLYTRRQAGGFLLNRRVVAGQLACSRKLTAALSPRFPSVRSLAPDKDMAVPVHPSVHRSTFYGRTDADVQPTHGKNTGGGRARVLSCRAGELQLARRIGCSSGLRKCH